MEESKLKKALTPIGLWAIAVGAVISGMVELGATYEPDPGRKAAYDEAYRRYLAAYYALVPVFNKFYKGE